MTSDPELTGSDHPPRSRERFLARGGVADAVRSDLCRDGVAVLQGPAGAGTSSLAMEVVRNWRGPATWIRPGLWRHLGDIVRPLWGNSAPDVLQQGSAQDLVEEVLTVVKKQQRLVILDDFDEVLRPPPGPSQPVDPELSLLLAALDSGELAREDGGFLLCSRRNLPTISTPVRPLPALSADDGARLGRRSLEELPDTWLRRPGALTLLRHLPDFPAPDIDDPWGDLVLELATRYLEPAAQEVLLGLSVVRNPVPSEGLAEALGLPEATVARALLKLLNLDLVLHRPGGWRSPRRVATASAEVLPELLAGVLPRAVGQRLAGWYFREGQDIGDSWTSADPAARSRLGLRYAAEARDPTMSLTFALHGGTVRILERLAAWRMLRNDLALALDCGVGTVGVETRARAWFGRARAAKKLADHHTVEASLLTALPLARQARTADLLLSIHSELATRSLLGGDPRKSREHLRSALSAASGLGDIQSLCDLHNQLGAVALQTGELDAAAHAFSRSLELARQLDDTRRTASRQAGLAGVMLYRGSLLDAQDLLTQALETAESIGDRPGAGHRLLNLALIEGLRGNPVGVLGRLTRLAGLQQHLGPRLRCRFLAMRSDLRRQAGDLAGARNDLLEAEGIAGLSGDREAVTDLHSARGKLEHTSGRFAEAVEAFEDARASLGPGRSDALVAARDANLWSARGWLAAAQLRQERRTALPRLLEAARQLEACLDRVPDTPFFPRWLTLQQQAIEVQLLASTAAGTAPMGIVRHLERSLDLALASEQRADTGEPVIRLHQAWALLLCAQHDSAEELARRSEFHATLQGLTDVAGRARVLLREDVPDWNRPALLLGELLSDARGGP